MSLRKSTGGILPKEKLSFRSLGLAEKTGLGNSQFDFVSMLDVLEHTDDVKTLQETSRILKKGGLVLISVPAYRWMWSSWDVVLHHKRRYTKGQVEKLLKGNGFSIVKSTYLYSFLLLPVFLVRKIKSATSGEDYSSDFKFGLPIIDRLLRIVSDFERSIALFCGIPFGLSIIILARKN